MKVKSPKTLSARLKWAVIILLLCTPLAWFGAVYRDYYKGVKIREAVKYGQGILAPIDGSPIEPSLIDRRVRESGESRPAFVRSARAYGHGRLTILVEFDYFGKGTLVLGLKSDAGGKVAWICTSSDSADWLPKDCAA